MNDEHIKGLLRCRNCESPLERTKDGSYACPKCPKDKAGKVAAKGDGVQFRIDGKDIFNS